MDVPSTEDSIGNAKFTMIGLAVMCLLPTVKAKNDELVCSFPLFLFPKDTNKPSDI